MVRGDEGSLGGLRGDRVPDRAHQHLDDPVEVVAEINGGGGGAVA